MNVQIKIETDVPFPADAGSKGRNARYPFDEMAVGHSFAMPDDLGKTARGLSKRQQQMSCAAINKSKRRQDSKRFATCIETVNGTSFIRIWRIK